MTGMFDDLIPQKKGMFDDLIPQKGPVGDVSPNKGPVGKQKIPVVGGDAPLASFVVGTGEGATLNAMSDILAAGDAVRAKLFEGDERDFSELFSEKNKERIAEIEGFQKANPKAFLGGNIAGGLATAVVPAGAALKGATLAAKAGRGALAGAGVGAVAGFNEGADLESRVEEAGKGAALGFGLGGTLPVAGAAVGKVTRSIVNSKAAKKVGEKLGVSPAVEKRLNRALSDSDLVSAPEEGERLFALSGQLRGQADTIVNRPGKGQKTLLDAVVADAEGSGSRIKRVIDKTLGKNIGRVNLRKENAQEKIAAGRMFKAAKKHPAFFDVRSVRNKIDEALSPAEGSVEKNLNFLRKFKIFNDQNVKSSSALQLHHARMAIDERLFTKRGKLGGSTTKALKDIRAEIDQRLKTIPGWREADEAFSVASKKKEAFEGGQKVFQRNLHPDELKDQIDNMTPEVAESFKKGARNSISALMGTARNDAKAVKRELIEKGWGGEKLEILLGKGRAKFFNKALEKEERIINAKDVFLRNSATQFRQAASKEFPNPVDSERVFREIGQRNLTGSVLESITRLADKLTAGAINRRGARISEEMAELLTSTGVRRDQIIKGMAQIRRIKGRKPNSAEVAEMITNMAGFEGSRQAAGAIE